MCSRHDDGRGVNLQTLLAGFDSMGIKYTVKTAADYKDGMFEQALVAPKPMKFLPYPFPIGVPID